MGNGDYAALVKQIKPVVKQALIEGGRAFGTASGVQGVNLAGADVGRRLSRLIGSGDYMTNEVSVNNLIKPKGMDANMNFGKDSLSIKLRHREFLGDISTGSTAGAFVNYAYNINPGLRTTFPYLSQLATNFELYCMKGLVFEFISSASPYVSTSALGTVIGSCEYNAAAPLYNSKFAMENSSLSVSTRLDKNLMYGIECAAGSNAQNCYFIRSGASTVPLTSTDLAIFQFGVAPGAGVPTNSVIGELWVTYDVEMSRPYLELARNGFWRTVRNTVTSANPLGTVVQTAPVGEGNLSNVVVTATSVSFPEAVVGDVYEVDIWTQFVTAGTWTLPGVTGTNLTLVGNRSAPSSSATSQLSDMTYFVQVTGPAPVMNLSGASYTGSGGNSVNINIISIGNYGIGNFTIA